MDKVDEYISRFPKDVQYVLQKIRQTIKGCAPDAEEVIGYGVPSIRMKENLLYYAAFKDHIGFYPTPSAIDHFSDDLKGYETSKGTVKFRLD